MDPLAQAPDWLLRPLPVNAAVDLTLHARIDTLAQGLPASLDTLAQELSAVRMYVEYDAAVNRASAYVWQALEHCLGHPDAHTRLSLLNFGRDHFTQPALARLLRRVAKDPVGQVRRA